MTKKLRYLCTLLLLWVAGVGLAQNVANNGNRFPRGDVNYDGEVNISDVTCLINYILTESWSEEKAPDGREWVDLGLPSGTLWATCNLGASAPEEYGDYFAQGETAPKDNYDWSTYKWCNGSFETLTKYCTNNELGNNGFVDDKTVLELEDDAAYVSWGPFWRMPTTEQQRELLDFCSSIYTTLNGVNGQLFTGRNGKTLFMPAGGSQWGDHFDHKGLEGIYWSCTLYRNNPNIAYGMYFESD